MGRGKRKREAETGKPFNYQGKKLTIYKRRHPHAAEDKRWVVILETVCTLGVSLYTRTCRQMAIKYKHI